jgi:hypothetical protein
MICVYVGASLPIQYSDKPIVLRAKAYDVIYVHPSGGERILVFFIWMQCPKSMLACLLCGLILTLRTEAAHSLAISELLPDCTVSQPTQPPVQW